MGATLAWRSPAVVLPMELLVVEPLVTEEVPDADMVNEGDDSVGSCLGGEEDNRPR